MVKVWYNKSNAQWATKGADGRTDYLEFGKVEMTTDGVMSVKYVNKGTEAVLAGCGSGQITARDMHFFPASVRSFSGVADRMSILTIL